MAPEGIADGLPPGPRTPAPVQTLGMLVRQRPYLERQRRRYGPMFTVSLGSLGRIVVVAEPALAKRVFTADAATLHAGSGSPLKVVLGEHSLLAIDEGRHLQQRRLLLPPMKGRAVAAYEPLIEQIAHDELDRWPAGEPFATGPSFQRLTLRTILRAVFGATGSTLRRLEELLPVLTERGQGLSRFPALQRDLGPLSPWGSFLRLRTRVDAVLDELIATGRADPELEARTDVLALLLRSRYEDGTPMGAPEIRDQLVTMLAAGHETTGHTLAWAVERLRRHPAALERLVAEVDAGGRDYRTATIREVQRIRPVIGFAGRFTRKPFELGGYRLPVGHAIAISAGLSHYDPQLFPEPDVFRPERFLDAGSLTYSWIPFGGGVRRCIGATFAHMELDVVLRTVLERFALEPTDEPGEAWRFKGVAWAPRDGGVAVLKPR